MPKLMKHPLHGFHYAQGAEEIEMLKNGWVEDIREVAPAVADSIEMPKPGRTELIAQAVEKGIKVDQRWSNERLASEIEKD
jgi:hypothetical protein